MDIIKKIEMIIEEPLGAQGYDIVRILMGGNHRKTLQIMIENKDGRNISIEDCEKVSRLSSVLLDQHDPISEAYLLEVSSPGLDRPLMKPKDFQRYVGHEATIKTHQLIEKRKIFVGCLETATDTEVSIAVKNEKNEQTIVVIPYNDIRSAKLYVKFD